MKGPWELRVEGWLAYPQSLSIVDQFQCLAWSRRSDLVVRHHELPPPPPDILQSRQEWAPRPGMLPPDLEASLRTRTQDGPGPAPDAVFRIAFPYDFREAPGIPTFVFAVTEYGILHRSMIPGRAAPAGTLGNGTRIVTPSLWSRQGLVNAGLPPDRIHVVPHGFEPRIHHPLPAPDRSRLRRELGWGDEVVFLAMGSLYPRKGTDLLLAAFARIAREHPDTRLVIKGVDAIYDSRRALATWGASLPGPDRDLVRSHLEYHGESLDFQQVTRFFQAADVLVSPYRAEGFNMPVLEALGCGLPVIVTGGGPTDEYVPAGAGFRIRSRLSPAPDRHGYWLDPDLEHLVDIMDMVVRERDSLRERGEAGARHVADRYSWDHVAGSLVGIMRGAPADMTGVTNVPEVTIAPSWRAWRDVCLRSAGFSVDGLTDLTCGSALAELDRLLELEDRLEQETGALLAVLHARTPMEDRQARKVWLRAQRALRAGRSPPVVPAADLAPRLDELERLRARLGAARTAWEESAARDRADLRSSLDAKLRDPRLHEALLWQGPDLGGTFLARLPQGDQADARAEYRRTMGLRFLQRYAAKNDTIGFFGPVAWSDLGHEGSPARFEPGESLLAGRDLHFEYWAVDGLATSLAAMPGLRAGLAPRLAPHVRLRSGMLQDARGGRLRLAPEDARLLAACDGKTPAGRIARDLGRLEHWARRGVLVWNLSPPVSMRPERALRESLERLEDPAIRDRATAGLDELESARARVAAAREDPATLGPALEDLDRTFERLTGTPARRNLGRTYGARSLVFEECRRDVALTGGAGALRAVGPALDLVLRSARWYVDQVGLRLDREVRRQLDAELARRGTRGVPLGALLPGLSRAIAPICRTVARLVRERWAAILPVDQGAVEASWTVESLRPSILERFPVRELSWPGARVHTVDLLLATPDLAALTTGGDGAPFVLGEVHPGGNLFTQRACRETHPDPRRMDLEAARDLGWPSIAMVTARMRDSHRTSMEPPEGGFQIAQDGSAPSCPPDRVLRLADLVVRRIRGRVHVIEVTTDRAFPVQLLFETFGGHAMRDSFSLLGPRTHRPRMNIDQLVIAREAWTLPFDELRPVLAASGLDRARWARRVQLARRMPRWLFATLASERKPFLIDLENPYSMDSFWRMVRASESESPGAAEAVHLTEMLPAPGDCWLTDRGGSRYTSELRLVIVDEMRWVPHFPGKRSPP